MTNLTLYKRTLQLKDWLENTEFDEYPAKSIEAANRKLSEIFEILDRRKP